MNGDLDLKNFLYLNSWFEKEFKDGLGERYDTFKTALNLFLQHNGKTIVETGTLRYKPKSKEFWSDGGATYLFGQFCEEYDKHLYTVDISRKAIADSKKFTEEFKDYITYVTSDSVEFLRHFNKKIDLLYLDSLDCPVEGDATEAQEHQLNELAAAVSKLSNGALILLDDNNFANGGKTRLAKDFLFNSGFTLLIDDQQSLWIKTGWRANIFCRLMGWKDLIFPYGTPRHTFYRRNLQPMVRRRTFKSGVGYIPTEQQRLFIDCSYVYRSGLHTGIQRVVRNVVDNCKSAGEKLGVECQPVVWVGSHFAPIESVDLEGRRILFAEQPQSEPKLTLWGRVKGRLKKILPKPVVRVIKVIKGAVFLSVQRIFKSFRRLRSEVWLWGKRISFKEGDILLLLDSSWHIPLWKEVREAKAKGATLGFALYDLIPIYAPQFCDSTLVKCFRKWLQNVVNFADFYVAISEATKNEFKRYLEEKKIPSIKGASFRLGAELDWGKDEGPIRDQVKEVFTGGAKPYIIVGTVEPRKNHEHLLDAFEKVWEAGIEAKLCIIGKVGWLTEDLIERIAEHPQQGELLFMFNDLSDTELSFCYENAKALVTPSLYEGFNLPIIEALSKKLPVLASDIPVHRETCGDYCVYFGLDSPQNLAKLIIDFEKKGQLPPTKSPEDFRWITWEESTEDLIKKIKKLA